MPHAENVRHPCFFAVRKFIFQTDPHSRTLCNIIINMTIFFIKSLAQTFIL